MNRINMAKKLSILLFSALFIFSGCKNQIKLDDVDKKTVGDDECSVKVSFTSSSREINPVAENTDLQNIVLKGKRSSERTMATLKTWTNYSTSSSDSVILKTTEWDFEVTAESHKNGVDIYYKGSLQNFALTKTTETIPFVLYVENYQDNNTSGTGAFDISLSLAKDFISYYGITPDKDSNYVKNVKVRMLDKTDMSKTLTGFDYVDITNTIDKDDFNFQKYYYSVNNLAPGQYFVEYTFTVLQQTIRWVEAINVVANYTTKGETIPNAIPLGVFFITDRTSLETFFNGDSGEYGLVVCDFDVGSTQVTYSCTKELTLDLYGNTISGSSYLLYSQDNSVLKVISSINKKGVLKQNGTSSNIYNLGTLSFDNIIIDDVRNTGIYNTTSGIITSIKNTDIYFDTPAYSSTSLYGITNDNRIDLIENVTIKTKNIIPNNYVYGIYSSYGYKTVDGVQKDKLVTFGTIKNLKCEIESSTSYGLCLGACGSVGKIENYEFISKEVIPGTNPAVYGIMVSNYSYEIDENGLRKNGLSINSIENCKIDIENKSYSYAIRFYNKYLVDSIKNCEINILNNYANFSGIFCETQESFMPSYVSLIDNIKITGVSKCNGSDYIKGISNQGCNIDTISNCSITMKNDKTSTVRKNMYGIYNYYKSYIGKVTGNNIDLDNYSTAYAVYNDSNAYTYIGEISDNNIKVNSTNQNGYGINYMRNLTDSSFSDDIIISNNNIKAEGLVATGIRLSSIPNTITITDCNINAKADNQAKGMALENLTHISEIKNIDSYACVYPTSTSGDVYGIYFECSSANTMKVDDILCDKGKTCHFVAEQLEKETTKLLTYGIGYRSSSNVTINNIGNNCVFEAKGAGYLYNSLYSNVNINNGTFIPALSNNPGTQTVTGQNLTLKDNDYSSYDN